MAQKRTSSVGPFLVREQPQSASDLARDLNRQLTLMTEQIDYLSGFRGPLTIHNGVDMAGNPVTNVGAGSAPANAATVAQVAEIEQTLSEAQRLVSQLRGQVAGALQLSSTTPTTIDAADVAGIGSETLASHGDHQHGVSTALVAAITSIGPTAAGVATSIPRGDHRHSVAVVATASLAAAGAGQDGLIVVENAGAGVLNLVIYGAGVRARLVGVAF